MESFKASLGMPVGGDKGVFPKPFQAEKVNFVLFHLIAKMHKVGVRLETERAHSQPA